MKLGLERVGILALTTVYGFAIVIREDTVADDFMLAEHGEKAHFKPNLPPIVIAVIAVTKQLTLLDFHSSCVPSTIPLLLLVLINSASVFVTP